MTDLVEIFETAADDLGYEFAYGAEQILNYEADKNVTLKNGEHVVFLLPFIEDGSIQNSNMHAFAVKTQIWVGRKFDDSSSSGNQATPDETQRQKYDRRLRQLRWRLQHFIKKTITDNDGLRLNAITIVQEINRFGTNIDFMTAQVTLEYDYTLDAVPEPTVTGDGSAYLLSTADAGLLLAESVEIEFYYYFEGINYSFSEGLFEVQHNGSNFLKGQVSHSGRDFVIAAKVLSVAPVITFSNFFSKDRKVYHIKIVYSGTSVSVYKNGSLVGTETGENLNSIAGTAATVRIMNVVAGGSPIQSGHSIFGFQYTTGGSLVGHWPICEDSGNIAYDVTGNGYHLTGQSGYSALTWNERNIHTKYLAEHGYKLSGSVYIPALSDGSAAADGGALTAEPPDTEFN